MDEIKQRFNWWEIIDEKNALSYLIRKGIENLVNTVIIVKVIAINEGTIDVIPLISLIDAEDNPIEKAPVYNVRYMQLQAGLNGIKLKPVIGDIGILLVSDRDTSKIQEGIALTNRRFNIADGIYLGGIYGLNQEPTQFIEIKENELNITGTQTININGGQEVNVTAPTVNVKGSTAINLGENAIQGIALQGMKVTNNGQPSGATVGFIAEGSTIVKGI